MDDTEILLPPNHAIVKNIVNIIVDEKHRFNDELTMEIAMKKTKETCVNGLNNFSEKLVSMIEASNGDVESIKRIFQTLEIVLIK